MALIVAQILGGLGNQMFQYAAARALSLSSGRTLLLDTSGFSKYGLHQGFELQRVFNCPAQTAQQADLVRVLGWQSSDLAKRLLSRPAMRWLRRESFVIEPHYNYWSGIDSVPQDAYLVGYWQSERYFSAYVDAIRQDLSFKTPLNASNEAMANIINGTCSVSLHVRRGDYVTNPAANSVHGLCSMDYYLRAVQHVAKQLAQPHFFVFSDDIEWAKNSLHIDFPCTFIAHNTGADSYMDMHLMSLCQHNIIANSSFSWWGAWLNANPGKCVIAPKNWFAKEMPAQDLIPAGWTVL
jgi:hypothetical protein